MNRLIFIEKLTTLERLIRQESTGSPEELAQRLRCSRSTLYEIINEMKLYGMDIKYSRIRRTFYYNNDVVLDIRFKVKDLSNDSDGYIIKEVNF